MSTNESDKMQAKEDIALYHMREEIAIYADQIQELAAENHKDTVVSLHLFSNYREFFMLNSVEDRRTDLSCRPLYSCRDFKSADRSRTKLLSVTSLYDE